MLGPNLTAGAETYNMTDIGRYVFNGSTLTLRKELSIDSTISSDKPSSFVVKHRVIADSLVSGAPDDVNQVHVVAKFAPGTTDAAVLSQLAVVKAVIDAQIAAIRRGER